MANTIQCACTGETYLLTAKNIVEREHAFLTHPGNYLAGPRSAFRILQN